MKRSAKLLALALGGGGLAAIAIAARSIALIRHPVGNGSVPEPVKPVDLQRYLGRWYEIARYDQEFEKGCEGSTADYALRPDGDISVINRCRKADGRSSDARGRAKVVDPATNAKLKVSFFGPFYGNYWVLDHADDYAWAIVGEPSGRYLWILHRKAIPGRSEVDRLVRRARALGYDTEMLIRTRQP